MLKRTTKGAGGLLVALIVFGVLFMLAMRLKLRPVQDAVRRMNRTVVNPRALVTAGQPGASASVVEHVGRTSGRPYRTPVQALPTGGGFVISLPYGSAADWVKNVLAAGSGTIVHEGDVYPVDHPEVVSGAVAASYFSPNDQRIHRLFGVDDFLQVHRVEPAEGSEPAVEK